jgi:hypothetical protein
VSDEQREKQLLWISLIWSCRMIDERWVQFLKQKEERTVTKGGTTNEVSDEQP